MNDTPTEIRVDKSKQSLKLVWSDKKEVDFSSELLRILSPSAEVQGHSPEQKKLVYGKRHVKISNILPVGNYAIRIGFDDGHNTGIFSWEYFHDLANNSEEKWKEYIEELEHKGLSR